LTTIVIFSLLLNSEDVGLLHCSVLTLLRCTQSTRNVLWGL